LSENKIFYAHSKEGKPPSEWQPREDHFKNVAGMTTSFPKEFRIKIGNKFNAKIKRR